MGRPLKEIRQKEFEGLCAIQCTKAEICGVLDVSDKTLEKWCKRTYKAGFSEVFAEKRGKGKVSLRRAQFRLAEKNANMAIWLGKQYLGQTDKVETQNTTAVTLDLSNMSTDQIKELLDDDIEGGPEV